MIITFVTIFASVLLTALIYALYGSKRFNVTVEGFTLHGFIAMAALSWLLTWLIAR